jgi:hypothetical protein
LQSFDLIKTYLKYPKKILFLASSTEGSIIYQGLESCWRSVLLHLNYIWSQFIDLGSFPILVDRQIYKTFQKKWFWTGFWMGGFDVFLMSFWYCSFYFAKDWELLQYFYHCQVNVRKRRFLEYIKKPFLIALSNPLNHIYIHHWRFSQLNKSRHVSLMQSLYSLFFIMWPCYVNVLQLLYGDRRLYNLWTCHYTTVNIRYGKAEYFYEKTSIEYPIWNINN